MHLTSLLFLAGSLATATAQLDCNSGVDGLKSVLACIATLKTWASDAPALTASVCSYEKEVLGCYSVHCGADYTYTNGLALSSEYCDGAAAPTSFAVPTGVGAASTGATATGSEASATGGGGATASKTGSPTATGAAAGQTSSAAAVANGVLMGGGALAAIVGVVGVLL